MNEQLSWLESIIIRRNLRSVELLENEEDHHGSDFTSESPYTNSLKDYLSTSGTSEAGTLFNPFDSPPLDLSEPPLLPPQSNSPLSTDVIEQQQQLFDILSLTSESFSNPNALASLQSVTLSEGELLRVVY